LTRFEAEGPQILRVGDLVELQVSFVVVPLKGHAAKVQTVLHSAALLDGQFSKVSRSYLSLTALLFNGTICCTGCTNQKTKRATRNNDQNDYSPRGLYDISPSQSYSDEDREINGDEH
jgi:hypothetical protein